MIVRAARSLVAVVAVACGPTTEGDPTTSDDEPTTTSSSASSSGASVADTTTDGATQGCAAPALPSPCAGSTPIMQPSDGGDVPTGRERCEDGRVHVVSIEACQFPASVTGSCSDEPIVECREDAECPGEHAFCNGYVRGINSTCECDVACENDADCGEGQACICDGARSRCVVAHCRTDADCNGGLCRFDTSEDGCEIQTLACEQAGTACASDDDCLACEDCVYVAGQCAFECRALEGACAAGCR